MIRNLIPEEWRNDNGRFVSHIGSIIHETPLNSIPCPKCGKLTLDNISVETDATGWLPIYQIVCLNFDCNWHAPESTKSTDCSDAIDDFKDWLEAMYLAGEPNCGYDDVELSFDFAEYFGEPMTAEQKKLISKRTIPRQYRQAQNEERTISPIGRLIERVPLNKLRCPSCDKRNVLYKKDISDYKKSPLPLCRVTCINCDWELPSGISRSPECAIADFHKWMEAWCLLGCQKSNVNIDLTEQFQGPNETGKDIEALQKAICKVDTIMRRIQKNHPERKLSISHSNIKLIDTDTEGNPIMGENNNPLLDYTFKCQISKSK